MSSYFHKESFDKYLIFLQTNFWYDTILYFERTLTLPKVSFFCFCFVPHYLLVESFFFSFCRKFWKCYQLFIILWCPNTKNIFSQKKYGIDLTWRKFHFSMLDCKNKIWLKVQNEKKNLIISYLFSNLFEVQGTASVQTIFYIPWKKNWK